LLSDVESLRAILVVISTSEELAKDRVVSTFVNTGSTQQPEMDGDLRLFHALGLDMPTSEVVLQDTDKALFWIVTILSTGQGVMVGLERGRACSPEYEIWVRHEVRDTLKHTPGLEHERREGDLGQVHPNSWYSGVRPEHGLQNVGPT